MPSFLYSARDKAGVASSGQLEVPGRREALRLLGSRGLQVLSLQEKGAQGSPSKSGKESGRSKGAHTFTTSSAPRQFSLGSRTRPPSKRERLPFLQALFDLTSSGLSAGEAVRLLSVRLKDPSLKALCQGLWEHISEGAPLSRAMSAFPKVFDSAIVNLISAGEATGSLNDTLARLIDHLTEQQELRRQLLSAMAYPAFMFCAASGVIMFFLFYLLPKMQGLLTSLGGHLPTSTRLLVATSNFTLHYGLFIAAAVAFSLVSFWRWRRSEAGRRSTDAWLLKLPLAGSLAVSQTVLAISQSLYVLLENGITTAEALKMTERQITNTLHREAFAAASARVLEGESLSAALARTGCFPDLVLDRLAVGENTGNMVPSLRDIARTYRKRISQQLSGATRVLASLIMMMVFTFVGFIAYAIVSAVFSMSTSFSVR